MKIPEHILSDWRYQAQDRFLSGLIFTFRRYLPQEGNDHDHCSFCGTKFSNQIEDALKEGWTNEDRYRWICDDCFQYFSKPLNLLQSS